MTRIMQFEEIDEFWDEWNDWSIRKYLHPQRNAHKVIKKMWDGKKRPRTMKEDETLLSILFRNFKRLDGEEQGRPMGNFRDLMDEGLTHEEAFNDLMARLFRYRWNKRDRYTNFIGELWTHADKLFQEHFRDDPHGKWITIKWDRQLFTDAMMIMMYSSTVGIVLEARAHKDLEAWLAARPKASQLFSYEPAANELESQDVDGVFRRKSDGEIVVKVSIKTVGAFTDHWIKTGYRENEDKAKAVPDIYAGYSSTKSEEIEFILVDDRSLKDLLREAAINGHRDS